MNAAGPPVLSQDRIANLFVRPSSPGEVLSFLFPGLQRRFDLFTRRYEVLLETMGFLNRTQRGRIRQSPLALREITLSSFEHAVRLFNRQRNHDSKAARYLAELIHIQVDRAVQAADLTSWRENGCRFYEIVPGERWIDCFPTSGIHRLLERETGDGVYRQLLAEAKVWMHRWDPRIPEEVDFFVRDWAMTYEDFYRMPYLSLDDQPGHVSLAPQRLLIKEGGSYERGSDFEAALVAGQMIHESRHQKVFFFHRALAARPNRYPTAFLKRRYCRNKLGLTFGPYVMQEMFDILPAVGAEYLYLKFIQPLFISGPYGKALEDKIEKKKSYIYETLLHAEQNRSLMTPLGRHVLDQILSFLESENK